MQTTTLINNETRRGIPEVLLIAKLTKKNQLTLPRKIVSQFPGTVHFAIEENGGRIILAPVPQPSLGKVREKVAALGVSVSDVAEAVEWSRNKN